MKSFCKKILALLFGFFAIAGASFASNASIKIGAPLNWKNPVNMHLNFSTKLDEHNCYMSLIVEDELQTLVSKDNLVFRRAPHFIRGFLTESKHVGIDNKKYVWKKGTRKFSCEGIKISVDDNLNSDSEETFGFTEIFKNKSKLNILSIKRFDKNDAPIASYMLAGGFKIDESSQSYVSKNELKNSTYVYEINVYFQNFNTIPRKKQHLRAWQKYGKNGKPADNFLHYEIDGSPTTVERWSEPCIVKNTDLSDSEFEKQYIKIKSEKFLRVYESLLFSIYPIENVKDGSLKLGTKKIKTSLLQLKRRTFKLNNKNASDAWNERDFIKNYHLDQNYEVPNVRGKTKFLYKNKNDWTLYEYQKSENLNTAYIAIKYSPCKNSPSLKLNKDGEISLADLNETPVFVKREELAEYKLKILKDEVPVFRPVIVEEFTAIASFLNGKVVLKNEKFLRKKRYGYRESKIDVSTLEAFEITEK